MSHETPTPFSIYDLRTHQRVRPATLAEVQRTVKYPHYESRSWMEGIVRVFVPLFVGHDTEDMKHWLRARGAEV